MYNDSYLYCAVQGIPICFELTVLEYNNTGLNQKLNSNNIISITSAHFLNNHDILQIIFDNSFKPDLESVKQQCTSDSSPSQLNKTILFDSTVI